MVLKHLELEIESIQLEWGSECNKCALRGMVRGFDASVDSLRMFVDGATLV